jgi:hypothetical protein
MITNNSIDSKEKKYRNKPNFCIRLFKKIKMIIESLIVG